MAITAGGIMIYPIADRAFARTTANVAYSCSEAGCAGVAADFFLTCREP